MITIGIILLVIGLVAGMHLLLWIGIGGLIAGLLFAAVGYAGHPVGGRRHLW